jgi:threonine/homoserine/homoserine lactone efflux protein
MGGLEVFLAALAVVYLIPGPDMILLLETAAVRGRIHALATALGLAMARAAHVTLAAVGLAALFKASPWVFDAVRLIGAGYLILLGIRVLRAPTASADPAHGETRRQAPTPAASLRRGLLTNLLNPKALLFCSVLLPQFVHPGQGAVFVQFGLLGTLLVALGLGFDVVYALAGGAIGRVAARSRTLQRLRNGLFASLLIGFGLRLALAGNAL